MKKIILSGAALSAALVAGQSFAAIPLIGNTPDFAAMRTAGLAETRIAGASAPTPVVERAFLNDCLGGAAYKINNGTSSFAWVCENAGTVASLPVATYPYLMLQKRDSGGSITGVVAALPFTGAAYTTGQQYGRAPFFTDATLAASVCAAPGAGVIACTTGSATANLSAATTNFADVDAGKFVSSLNGAVPGAGAVASSSVASQVFGFQVTLKLYRALQATAVGVGALPASCLPTAVGQDETQDCMPSLTSEQLTSILGLGRFTDWRNLRVGTTATTQRLIAAAGDALPTNFSVHACQRTTGSGTLATQYLKVHNAPCFDGAEPLLSNATQTIGTESGTIKVLHSMSAQGDVDNCLQALNDGANVGTFTPYGTQIPAAGGHRWAIGFSSADRNETNAKPFRFIKVDGIAPTLENVVKGRYRVWAELTQVGAAPVAGTPATNLAIDLLDNMRNANQLVSLTKTFSWGTSGLLGIATSSAFPPSHNSQINGLQNAAFDPNRPVNPYTHGIAGGANGAGIDHCRMPALPGGARSMPALY